MGGVASQEIDVDFAGANGTTNAIADGANMTLSVGGDEQVITFAGDEDTIDKVLNQINSQLKGASAVLNEDGDKIQIKSTEDISAVAFAGGANALSGGAAAANVTGSLREADVTSVNKANEMMVHVDSALETVNSLRGELGAIQNRFESTIANLSTSIENMSASQSRILDADFAAETAKMSKAQVLQQAGISVLAQANARPQQVLSLLQ